MPNLADTTRNKLVTRLNDLSLGRGDLFKLDPRTIRIEPGFNARRFDSEQAIADLKMLSENIAANGVLVPLVVRYKDSEAWLVDGERRLRATLAAIENGAEIKTVPAIGAGTMNEADRVASLFTYNSDELRKPLTMLEQSSVVVRLSKFGWTNVEIAKRLSVSGAHISNLLKLAEAPEDVKAAITAEKVSASTVVSSLRAQGPEQTSAVVAKAINGSTKVNGKASGSNVRAATKKTSTYRYTQGDAKNMIGAFQTILSEVDGRSSVARICKNILEQYDQPLTVEEDFE